MRKPKLFLETGLDAKTLRRKLKMNQNEFWGPVSVTQSGGSRYESGREMPPSVAMLLHLTYAPEKRAAAMYAWLRSQQE